MSRLPLLLLLCTACNEYDLKSQTDPPRGKDDKPVDEPQTTEIVENIRVTGETLGADIIFFGDTSGSMNTELSAMGANVTRFVDRLAQDAGNWHLMAITQPDGCALHMLHPGVNDYAGKFADDIVKPPPLFQLPDRTEQGLYVVREALRQTEPGGCNAGFLRPDAQLHVIFISDERDQSPGYTNGANYWANYLNEYVSFKDHWTMAKFSAVAGPVPGGCDADGDGVLDAEEGTGYFEVVDASEGEYLSICDDWPEQLDTLADASVRQHRFILEEDADPDTIVVYVNDVDREGDWDYIEAENVVRFLRNAPQGGDRVRIEYDTIVD